MNITEFCGKIEFSTLQFAFSLTDHLSEKISKKELFNKEQIVSYVKKQIDSFFKSLNWNFKSSVLNVYKSEVYNTVMFKINYILKEQNHPSII